MCRERLVNPDKAIRLTGCVYEGTEGVNPEVEQAYSRAREVRTHTGSKS